MKFDIFDEFLLHFNTEHPKAHKMKCSKCSKATSVEFYKQHLEECYNIAQLQCAYCVRGFNNVQDIYRHLADHHSSNFPVFWERRRDQNETMHLK